jgi:hypothetical protein
LQRQPVLHLKGNDRKQDWEGAVSLIDSYAFKAGVLVKKAISVIVSGVAYHLVSYYTMEDITHERLLTPCDMYQSVALHPDLNLQRSIVCPRLYNNTQLFRQDAWTGGQTISEREEQSTQPQWSTDYNSIAITDYEQLGRSTFLKVLKKELDK